MKNIGKAIGGALKGLLCGFGLFMVFAIPAVLTSASSITNLFTALGSLSVIICPIIGIIKALKSQSTSYRPTSSYKSTSSYTSTSSQQSLANSIEQSLKAALRIIQTTQLNSQENIKRYVDACDTLLSDCAEYSFHPVYEKIVKPYRQAIYSERWPVYRRTRTGNYEYVVGTELAEELQKALRAKRATY